MSFGILAGVTWALETVILGIALTMTPFVSTVEALFLAPFVSTFLHDLFSAVYMWIYNGIRGKLPELFGTFKTKSFKWLTVSSAIGGPVGMTGYVLAVKYMGASIGAVASAIYPAIGTVLAVIFLKEKMKWYRWIFLAITLLGVFGLSYSPGADVGNFWLGLIGTFMCAFGWGIEAVILAKCLRNTSLKNEYALCIRQTTSALIYGLILLPILRGVRFTASLFASENLLLFGTVALAALFATVSYLFYYKSIGKLGASKTMALNITYTAWAIFFTVTLLGNTEVLDPTTVICAAVVVIFGILAATDLKELLQKKDKINP